MVKKRRQVAGFRPRAHAVATCISRMHLPDCPWHHNFSGRPILSVQRFREQEQERQGGDLAVTLSFPPRCTMKIILARRTAHPRRAKDWVIKEVHLHFPDGMQGQDLGKCYDAGPTMWSSLAATFGTDIALAFVAPSRTLYAGLPASSVEIYPSGDEF